MSGNSGISSKPISVFVADSNQTECQLLCGALRRQGAFRVDYCQGGLSACLASLANKPTDVILVAERPTELRQKLYEFVRGLHSTCPGAAIVVLIDGYDRELVINSLRAGARGLFCLASAPFKALCRCITSVHAGQYWTNTEQMRFVVDALSVGPAIHVINSRGQAVLTPREEQTVSLAAEGLNNREIARELAIKENTVKKSLLRIYDKLGVSNRVELVLYALSHGEQRAPDLLPAQTVAADD